MVDIAFLRFFVDRLTSNLKPWSGSNARSQGASRFVKPPLTNLRALCASGVSRADLSHRPSIGTMPDRSQTDLMGQDARTREREHRKSGSFCRANRGSNSMWAVRGALDGKGMILGIFFTNVAHLHVCRIISPG
jgi:hypothetical protein